MLDARSTMQLSGLAARHSDQSAQHGNGATASAAP